MLSLRNATRLRFRPNLISISTRPYIPTQPSHPLAHGYTWKTWIFHRRDGTRRSKTIGALLVTAIAGTSYIYYALHEGRKYFSTMNGALKVLVCLQRLDNEYSTYDFANPTDTVVYLQKVMKCHSQSDPILASESNIDKVIEIFGPFVTSRAGQGSHLILRESFEKLHQVIERSGTQTPFETVQQVAQTLTEGLDRLKEEVHKHMADE